MGGGFANHGLEDVALHKQSKPQLPAPSSYCDGKPGSRGSRKRGAVRLDTNLSASLQPWECNVYDVTDLVLLLTTARDPTVIVKLQNDPQKKHVADEMAQEAAMYAALEGNEAVQEVIPRFHGYITHLGVAMTCVEKELDDFDDIGLANLSDSLMLYKC
jgi:hypothetical protein